MIYTYKQIILILYVTCFTLPIHAMEPDNGALRPFEQFLTGSTPTGFSRGVAGSVAHKLIKAQRKRMKKIDGIKATAKGNETLLHCAGRIGEVEAMKYLLDANADIETKDSTGKAVLHIAASTGQLEAVRLLLENKANIEAADNTGKTALHMAAITGQLDAVGLLLENKANIETADNTGSTALHIAASTGQLEAVRLLLKNKANIKAVDKAGKTALHMASWAGIVRLLLENGADIRARDQHDQTPLHIAALSSWDRKDKIVELLVGFAQLNPSSALNVSRAKIVTILCIFKRNNMPPDISKNILAHFPEYALTKDHCKFLFNNNVSISKLVEHCPFTWFKAIYEDTHKDHRAKFLEMVMPTLVENRLGKMIEFLSDESFRKLDPNQTNPTIIALLNPNNVEQHRNNIKRAILMTFTVEH